MKMFLRNTILAVLLVVPVITYAGVTVYDERAGMDVDAKLRDGNLEKLPELIIKQAPRQAYQDPLLEEVKPIAKPKKRREKGYIQKTASPSDIELIPWEVENYDLGHAQVFVEAKEFSRDLAKNITTIQDIEGLRVSLYIKAPEHINDLVTLGRGLLKMRPGQGFSTDSSNKRFKALGLQDYMVVHYTSPFGDARAFPLENPQYILNKVADVRRKVRGQ